MPEVRLKGNTEGDQAIFLRRSHRNLDLCVCSRHVRMTSCKVWLDEKMDRSFNTLRKTPFSFRQHMYIKLTRLLLFYYRYQYDMYVCVCVCVSECLDGVDTVNNPGWLSFLVYTIIRRSFGEKHIVRYPNLDIHTLSLTLRILYIYIYMKGVHVV